MAIPNRRGLLVSGLAALAAAPAAAAWAQEDSSDQPAPDEPDVFGVLPLRDDEDAVRAAGSLGGFSGIWMVEIRARTPIGSALRIAALRRRRLEDRTVSISLREYRRLKAEALALCRAELAQDAEDRVREDRLHQEDPAAPYTVPAVCLDGPTVTIEIGGVKGGVISLDGKGCYDPDDDDSAAAQVRRRLEGAAHRHGL